MERKIKQALCLSWQEASEIISNQLNIALGQEILCKARLMDEVYWAVFTSGHVFTIDELVVLLTYADAKPDVCAEVFSIEGDTTKSLPSELSLTVAQESAPPELGTRISHGIRLVDAGHHNGDLIGGKVMDEVIKDAIGRYGAKIVGLDDSFEFRCTECGKCCTNREDILLTPRDLFRAAKELNMTVMDFFSEYCEKYIGDNSRLPLYASNRVAQYAAAPCLRTGAAAYTGPSPSYAPCSPWDAWLQQTEAPARMRPHTCSTR